MADSAQSRIPPPSRAMSRKTAIVGVGESDYALDYQAERKRVEGYEPPTTEGLSILAFERALADAGLERRDIDGVSVSFTYGGPAPEEMAALLGLQTRVAISNGNIMAGPLPRVCAAITDGRADTVAMIFAVNGRARGRQFGGNTYTAEYSATPATYYYFHPWGWSSQAAHWAFVARYYMHEFGLSEADMGAIPVQLRQNAQLTAEAVMRAPMSIEDYLASRYIVRPLHLLDMCLVNDGAVCLIVRRADLARDLAQPPVLVAGWGESFVHGNKLHELVRQRLRPQLQEAGGQALEMAGLSLADIGHFEGYDAATMQLVNQIEGYGFFDPGTTPRHFQAGDAAPKGALAINTAGGMLSGAYLQGWNQVVEVVRQLRHQAGARQVPGLQASMSSLAQTDAAHPIVYVRER